MSSISLNSYLQKVLFFLSYLLYLNFNGLAGKSGRIALAMIFYSIVFLFWQIMVYSLV